MTPAASPQGAALSPPALREQVLPAHADQVQVARAFIAAVLGGASAPRQPVTRPGHRPRTRRRLWQRRQSVNRLGGLGPAPIVPNMTTMDPDCWRDGQADNRACRI